MPRTIVARFDWTDPDVLEKSARAAATVIKILIQMRDRLSRQRQTQPSEKYALEAELQRAIDTTQELATALAAYIEQTTAETKRMNSTILRAVTVISERLHEYEGRLTTLEARPSKPARTGKRRRTKR